MEKSSLGLENFGHRWSDNLGSNCEHIVTASGSSFSSAHNYGEFMILKYLILYYFYHHCHYHWYHR